MDEDAQQRTVIVDPADRGLIAGRYRFERRLGMGGMAEVVLATDLRLRRRVALKLLAPALASDPVFVERFRREAVGAASLNHPNIVAVYDHGDADGRPFIAMEYVEGETLKELVLREGALAEPRVVAYAEQLLTALEEAHAAGIVHRDVKPQNVLITPAGTVKVADFGIATSAAALTQLTQHGSIVGTAAYISPEQALSQPATARSDVYSAGVCLFEMTTGALPYTGNSPVEVANQHAHAAVPFAGALRPGISPRLQQVIEQAMAKEPERRYASAGAMRAALVDQPVARKPEPTSSSAQTQVLAGTQAATAVLPTAAAGPRRKRARLVIGAALVAAVVVAALLVNAFSGSGAADVRVPAVWHQPLARGTKTLRTAGFKVATVRDAQSSQPAGTILAELPNAGTVHAAGTTVTLTISAAPLSFALPDVAGLSVDGARGMLIQRGLVPELSPVASRARPKGVVIDSTPAVGTLVSRGATITLLVSTGQPPGHEKRHHRNHGG